MGVRPVVQPVEEEARMQLQRRHQRGGEGTRVAVGGEGGEKRGG